MLSYAKHGKFLALTQAARLESRRKKRPFRPNDRTVASVPRLQWIMGRTGPQMRRSSGAGTRRLGALLVLSWHYLGAALRCLAQRRRKVCQSYATGDFR
jgi:hypothetical protein